MINELITNHIKHAQPQGQKFEDKYFITLFLFIKKEDNCIVLYNLDMIIKVKVHVFLGNLETFVSL